MKKCFTEELIIGRLKETKARMKVAELCRKHGILDATSYKIINFYHFLATEDFLKLTLGGDGGIRTLDALLAHTPLAGEHLRPLGHVS